MSSVQAVDTLLLSHGHPGLPWHLYSLQYWLGNKDHQISLGLFTSASKYKYL